MGYDPDTLIKLKVRVASVTRGFQLDVRGGIFQRNTVRLFHVADKVSQNYLLCSCLLALFVVGPNFPKIGAATSSTPRLFIPATQT